MSIEIKLIKPSNLFEQFLVLQGNIDLTEFYNLVFQKFFDDCEFLEMRQRSTALEFSGDVPHGRFVISLRIRLGDAASDILFPDRKDRNVFYKLLFETRRHSQSEPLPRQFVFGISENLKDTFTKLLAKLSAIKAEIDAAIISNESKAHLENFRESNRESNRDTNRRFVTLRFVEDFEIAETGREDRYSVKIEFADWLRRGFNEQFLDKGILPLLTQNDGFNSEELFISSVSADDF